MAVQDTEAPTFKRPSRAPQCPGRYEVRELLGRGGGGSVWLAWDPELAREVALKRIDGSDVWCEASRQQFLAEARVTARLEHPAIVPVYDAGVDGDGAVYYVMRRVRGDTLRQVLDTGTWGLERRLSAFLRVCEGVAYAHARHIVHGDLKPENIMAGPFGEVLVVDWGASADPAVGTPAYMAPECFEGQRVAGSDVWALGLILGELVGSGPDELRHLVALTQRDAPAERPSVSELAERLSRWVEGTERRVEADGFVADAQAARTCLSEVELDLARAREREGQLRASLPPWTALADKQGLLAARAEVSKLTRRRDQLLLEVVNEAERALARVASHAGARRVLADVWWDRLRAAEARDDRQEVAFCKDRVRAYEDTAAIAQLDAGGVLLVAADVPVEVDAAQWNQDALVWEPGPLQRLGETPVEIELAPGSWRVRVGGVTVPVVLRRGSRCQVGPLPPGPVVPGTVRVPGGPFRVGGDAAAGQQHPPGERDVPTFSICVNLVTMREYLWFIRTLPADEARRRVPRRSEGPRQPSTPYWSYTDDGWQLPEVDADGDVWSPDLPVFAVSWYDACAYAAWRASVEDLPWRLPGDLEWEKAARGVDGRYFPWGDEFDASLCHMDASRPGRPQPVAVGTTPGDVSPYGVHDMAGLVREWCGDTAFNGDRSRRAIRGGCWNGAARICRAANRIGYDPETAEANIGFRLAVSG